MTSAYPACYIESAQRVLGQMLDYAVCRLLLTPDDAMQAFIRRPPVWRRQSQVYGGHERH